MADPKRAKIKKAPRKDRKERRFAPSQTHTSLAVAGVGLLGSALLGAGVYSQWIMDAPPKYGVPLVVAGALGLAGALWFGDAGAYPVRVGDAGVAVERGTELVRLAWCELKRVFAENGQLVLEGEEATLSLPIGAHPVAVAWILAEGTKRVPSAMDVKESALAKLPSPKDGDGELLTVEGIQVAGKHCRASGEVLSFEGDARLCPSCGEVYVKGAVPDVCLTCNAKLGARAVEVA